MISDRKHFMLSFQISITLLAILPHLQILLYFMNTLFHVLQHFRSYHQTIHMDIPSNRGSTLPSIQDFKWAHLGRGPVAIIVCKLYHMQIVFPPSGFLHDIHPQHVFDDLVCSFCFPIYFRVIASADIYIGFKPRK